MTGHIVAKKSLTIIVDYLMSLCWYWKDGKKCDVGKRSIKKKIVNWYLVLMKRSRLKEFIVEKAGK